MTKLVEIRYTVQQVAEAISSALGVDTEIVDKELNIIAGTGRYKERVGLKEEDGRLDSGYVYSRVLTTGQGFIIEDARHDPSYDSSVQRGDTEELAEVCCPICYGEEVLGVIGLVAFSEEQRKVLLRNKNQLEIFLRRMGFLIASKCSENEKTNQLHSILETIHEGIIAIDEEGLITLCNKTAEKLIRKSRREMVGHRLSEIWTDFTIPEVFRQGADFHEREESYVDPVHGRMHFLTTVRPIFSGEIERYGSNICHKIKGMVISFRDMADVHRLVYDLTEKRQVSSFDEILGVSQTIQAIKESALRVAQSNSTVLITGESGTGKELFARAIHYASPRSKGPFVTVNCGAIPETLLESELFGYEGGAFTGAKKGGKAGKFEIASGGTVFLDEIGDLPLHLQVKLLHVLQRREMERVGGNRVIPVDVRVIAATNRNLEQMMQEGEFREDLYFRLNVIPLHIPPLRERQEDIKILLDHSLEKYNKLVAKDIAGFDQQSLQFLLEYDWPGNVRELENTVEYAVNMTNGELITVESLPPRLRKALASPSPVSLKEKLESYEREILQEYINLYGNSLEGKRKIADILQISQATLYRKIKELGIMQERTNKGF